MPDASTAPTGSQPGVPFAGRWRITRPTFTTPCDVGPFADGTLLLAVRHFPADYKLYTELTLAIPYGYHEAIQTEGVRP